MCWNSALQMETAMGVLTMVFFLWRQAGGQPAGIDRGIGGNIAGPVSFCAGLVLWQPARRVFPVL